MAKIKLKSSEERLADLGRIVTRKLQASGRAQIVEQNNLALYCVQDFMSPTECEELMGLIDKGRQPSGLLAKHPDPDFRTSDSCNLSPYDPLVEKIEGRICTLMGIDPRHGETLQGQVYEIGQQFKAHHDHCFKNSTYWDDMAKQGGQRSWTRRRRFGYEGTAMNTAAPLIALEGVKKSYNLGQPSGEISIA